MTPSAQIEQDIASVARKRALLRSARIQAMRRRAKLLAHAEDWVRRAAAAPSDDVRSHHQELADAARHASAAEDSELATLDEEESDLVAKEARLKGALIAATRSERAEARTRSSQG